MTTTPWYLQKLGLTAGATERDIKKAFMKLSLKTHPDKVPPEEKERATSEFREVSEAYQQAKEKVGMRPTLEESWSNHSKEQRESTSKKQYNHQEPLERSSHLRQVEYHLSQATCYAKLADRRTTEQHLYQATEHAKMAGIHDAEFLARVLSIHCSIQNEFVYHSGEMQYHAFLASEHRRNGVDVLMNYHLKQAKGHARKAGITVERWFI